MRTRDRSISDEISLAAGGLILGIAFCKGSVTVVAGIGVAAVSDATSVLAAERGASETGLVVGTTT
jgi:hypothetical protein